MLHCCLYRSLSLVPPRSSRCADIYLTARELNPRVGITGYLHQEDGFFVQFIEGPRWSISALVDSIERDSRHTAMTILQRYDASERKFHAWDMAFSDDETRRFWNWSSNSMSRTCIASASARQLLDFMLDRSAVPRFKINAETESVACHKYGSRFRTKVHANRA